MEVHVLVCKDENYLSHYKSLLNYDIHIFKNVDFNLYKAKIKNTINNSALQ